jgi:hypothetical protein
VLVLGKNAEPKEDIEMIFRFTNKLFRGTQKEFLLSSDKNGRVSLGYLKDISAINVRI